MAGIYTPSGGYGVYGLNQHSEQLDDLYEKYEVRNIDAGYLFLKQGEKCLFSNITDGSMVNPVTGHIYQFQEFTDLNGASLSFTISGGADSGTVDDPLEVCTQDELFTFVEEVISNAKAPVSAISFDIEGAKFRGGDFNKGFYDKIGGVMSKLKENHPNLETNATIPQYSGYWKGGYNDALKNFFVDWKGSIDYFYAMTSVDKDRLVGSMVDTMGHLPEDWPKSKTVVFLTVGGSNDPGNYAAWLESNFSDYAGISTLLTTGAEINEGNASLYKDLNGGSVTPTDPDNYTLEVDNNSMDVGINVVFEKNSKILFKTNYLAPSKNESYDHNTPVSTKDLEGQDNVTVKFEYWATHESICSEKMAFNRNKTVRINVTNADKDTFTCEII